MNYEVQYESSEIKNMSGDFNYVEHDQQQSHDAIEAMVNEHMVSNQFFTNLIQQTHWNQPFVLKDLVSNIKEKPEAPKSRVQLMKELKLQLVKRPKHITYERLNRPRTECITQIQAKSSLEKISMEQLLAVKMHEQ